MPDPEHHIHLHLPDFSPFCHPDPFIRAALERIFTQMSVLTDSVNALVADVQTESTELASITTYIQGVPALVAAAVTQALKNAGVDDSTAAAEIDSARSTIQSSVNAALAAVQANTPADTTPAAPATDTTAAPAADATDPATDTTPSADTKTSKS